MTLRGIAHEFGKAKQSAPRVIQGLDGICAPKARCVFANVPPIVLGLVAAQRARQLVLRRTGHLILRREDDIERLAQDLNLRVTKRFFGAGVPADDDPSRRYSKDRVFGKAVNQKTIEHLVGAKYIVV